MPKFHAQPGFIPSHFSRVWNAERRRPRWPDPLVVEAATQEVDADRWRERLEEWQDRKAIERVGTALARFLLVPWPRLW